MASKRHDQGHVCLCDQADGTCAGLAVRRLGRDRLRELAEDIWAASSGDRPPARPALADPRSSRAGASAQAAYLRRRDQERERGQPALVWLVLAWGMLGAAPAAGLLVGVTVGAWLGWPVVLLVALLAWSRLRFRPSAEAAIWRRQAALQRRTAGLLAPLAEQGYLVLHDRTLPGWLDSLDHLVVGPTGVWVVESWQHRRWQARRNTGAPAGTLRELRWKAGAVADLLDGGASVPVRGLLCLYRGWPSWPRSVVQGVQAATPRQLARVVRQGSPVAPEEVDLATALLLEALRPAA